MSFSYSWYESSKTKFEFREDNFKDFYKIFFLEKIFVNYKVFIFEKIFVLEEIFDFKKYFFIKKIFVF